MLNALSVFNLLHCWQRGKIFQVSNSKIPHCKNIECCHANKVIHRVWKCPSHVKIGLKQRNYKKIWTWILYSCGRAKHFKTNSHINPKPYLLREMVNHYQCSFLMKPEEHTSHCAGDISLQKAKISMVASEFLDLGDLWRYDPLHPSQKGPRTPCWRTHSFHPSLLCAHLPRQKHLISEFEHAQGHTHIVIWTQHTPTISHCSLQSHLQQPETLLCIQPVFSSPFCTTAPSPEPCSSAWFTWAHLVKINTEEGNPLGWLNSKTFGCRTPSRLCA